MRLRVVSFNIRCCDDPNGHSIPERAPRLGKVINACQPDLIGLQECRPAWEEHLARLFGGEYTMFHRYRCLHEDVESGPVLWRTDRYDCLKTGCFWLSDTPDTESRGWDEKYNCYRICTWVLLRHKESGRVLAFYNTHFGFGDAGQVKSAELIRLRSRELDQYPTLITGDFNMTPESPGYAAMTKEFTDVNAVTARDFRTTWHGYDPAVHDNEHIDYCFINSRFRAVEHRVLDETVDGKFPSDHYGIYNVLEFDSQEEAYEEI